jgi:hypothetical protein
MTSNPAHTAQLFPLGQIASTLGAWNAFAAEGITGAELLQRHQTGDWGDISEHDQQENTLSLMEGFRILSAYTLPRTKVKLWIITEADRSLTTFLLPEEY